MGGKNTHSKSIKQHVACLSFVNLKIYVCLMSDQYTPITCRMSSSVDGHKNHHIWCIILRTATKMPEKPLITSQDVAYSYLQKQNLFIVQ